LLSKISRRTFAHVLSVLLPRLLVMIPALIAAVASMVIAIIATIAVVSHREMDDRNRRLCISAAVVGTAAALLIVGLNPEIFRRTLTCLAYVLPILAIGIAAKVTGIATKMNKVVVHMRRQRRE
jgi:4-amino-4-deoxy-L-arabinose transferase-like glycosyltransferase